MSCFNVKGDFDVCPYCGWVEGTPPKEAYHLHPRTLLNNRYVIGTVLGYGGFGVTYKAWDMELGIKVAVKEYYPSGLVNRVPGEAEVVIYSGEKSKQYGYGLKRFLDEARQMAKFSTHMNIVNIYNFFEQNNTAYIVMEYLEGISLKQFLQQSGGILDVDTALQIILPVADALEEIHSKGTIHRDVSPDNIFITAENKVKLIDFGAARLSAGDKEETLSVILKPGFAPPEQYRSKSKQGAFTDIYALGATLYRLVTGVLPEESVDRLFDDSLKRPSELGIKIPDNIERAIMKALSLKEELRFQNIAHFKEAVANKRQIDFPEVELKKRQFRRRIWASGFALLAVALIVGTVLITTVLKPKELSGLTVKADTISIWVGVNGADNSNQQAMNDIVKQFNEKYPQVKVNIEAVPQSEYAQKINQAKSNNSLPTMFCSDELDIGVKDFTVSLNSLYNSLDVNKYYFLDKYKEYFPDMREMPVGFSESVIYANDALVRNLNVQQTKAKNIDGLLNLPTIEGMQTVPFFPDPSEYDALAFTNGSSLLSGQKVSCSDSTFNLLDKIKQSLDTNKYDYTKSGIDNLKSGKLVYYLSNTTMLRQVQTALPGNYSVSALPGNHYFGSFTDKWCIAKNSTVNQQNAAMLLLSYMLDEYSQNVLHIQHDNAMPINKATYELYINTNQDLAFLKPKLDSTTFNGQYDYLVNSWGEGLYKSVISASGYSKDKLKKYK
jgi:serine/threonine protein kinase